MATLSVVTALLTIVFIQRVLKNLLTALIMGILVLASFHPDVFREIHKVLIKTGLSPSYQKLVVAVFLIYLLTSLMESSGDSSKFSEGARKLFGSKETATSLTPMLIGLMPMPGGALFTAPMVKSMDEKGDPLILTAKNYWFRHTIEFFWPIYPAIILTSELSKMSVSEISIKLLPVFLVSVLSGWFFFNGPSLPKFSKVSDLKTFLPILPILSTGVLILVFKLESWFALLINVSIYSVFRSKYFLRSILNVLKRWQTFMILTFVYIFKVILEIYNIGDDVASEIIAWGIPIWVLVVFLPLVAGMSTGITQGAVGISLPVILGITGKAFVYHTYIFAVAGVLLSPVHLCVILTSDFFNVDVFSVLKKILIPLTLTVAFSVIWFFMIT